MSLEQITDDSAISIATDIRPLPAVIHENGASRVEIFNGPDGIYARKTVKAPAMFGIRISGMARYLCAREVGILEKLQGVEGVQQLIEQDSPTSFISRYIDGKTLKQTQQVPPEYFDKLSRILESVHGRGIADLDFAHSDDLLVDKKGNPWIIDLTASVICEPGSNLFTRLAFDYVCKLNKTYLLRRKAKYALGALTLDEQRQAETIGALATTWRSLQAMKRYVKYEIIGQSHKSG